MGILHKHTVKLICDICEFEKEILSEYLSPYNPIGSRIDVQDYDWTIVGDTLCCPNHKETIEAFLLNSLASSSEPTYN